MRDREISYELTRRAAAAGFDTLHFTVDTPVAGARLRDKRNGLSIPPQLTLGTIINAVPRPWWWFDFLTTPKLEFASLSTTGGTVGELLDAAMDPTISYDDLAVIRDLWPGKIIIKGVQNVEDSVRLRDAGAGPARTGRRPRKPLGAHAVRRACTIRANRRLTTSSGWPRGSGGRRSRARMP